MGVPQAAAAAALSAIPGFGAAALLPTADGLTNASYPVHLEAGVAMPMTITTDGGAAAPLQVRLAWATPNMERTRIEEAVAAARTAHTVVLFAYDEGTEGRDRASLSLPGYQDRLIDAVAAANPRTVVVLNNGAPILMPWVDKVAAILQMWYPGQEGADATAAILVGEASPGGRLPVTFPRRAEDAPTARPERYPGVDGHGAYSEGIFVGYRWYDQQKLEPLFPFGHGLSYTTFSYSGLTVRPATDGYDVTFTIKNTGTREGVEVPQVYIGPPANAPAPMALEKLVGFERVSLAPGQSRQLRVHVDVRALSYWSSKDHRWMVAPGRRTFMVGASSRNIALKADVTVRTKAT
jgi:beta-glucosidase